MTSVLYDVPGPRAKVRNWIFTGVFLVLLGLASWWILSVMADKHQLDADKWSPFVTDGQVWTTFLIPGLLETLKAGAIAMVIALPLGALLGIGRLSDHAWVRVPVGTVVEFFRAIPVLMLMLFGSAFFVQFTTVASDVRPLYAVIAGLVLYNAAVIAEIVRAGVLSLPRGQTDAAKAIGMRKGQTMAHVLIPQAVTAMLAGPRQPARGDPQGHRARRLAAGPHRTALDEPADLGELQQHHRLARGDRTHLHRGELRPHHLRLLAGGAAAEVHQDHRSRSRPRRGQRHGHRRDRLTPGQS